MNPHLRRSIPLLTLTFTAAAALLAGCKVGPNYQRPGMDVPEQWLSATRPSAPMGWWANFNDPQLDSLIRRAVVANLDLRLAGSRIAEARALRTSAGSSLYPAVNTSGRYTRSRSSENLFSGGGGGDSSSGGSTTGGFALPGEQSDLFAVGFDASWEIDLWGRVRRGVEAADADLQASIEGRRDAMVSVMAEVARNYVELRAFQKRLAITRENVEAQEKTLRLVEGRARAGVDRDFDVVRQRALVNTTTSQIPLLEGAIRQTQYQLAVLLGRTPGELIAELSPRELPRLPEAVPAGLPSDLLRRRADIRRAERELAAATARVGVATADLFPRISLTGSLGLQSDEFKNLFQGASRAWSIGPSVFWPLFDAGRIRANIAIQNARQEQALIGYQRSVLIALQDVESALIGYAKEQERRKVLGEAVTNNQRAVSLANERYQAGLESLISVLDAQRQLFAAQDSLVQSDRAVAENLVALYKALGGGWEDVEQREMRERQEQPAPR